MSTTTLDRFDIAIRDQALEDAVIYLENRWQHVRTLRHEDGSATVIEHEEYIEPRMSPREDDGNLARLVNRHRDYVDLDDYDSGIEEAIERFGYESELVDRYVAMFRPDIAHFEQRWEVTGCSQSDWQYGYGFVLWDDLRAAGLTPEYMAEHGMTPESVFEGEVKVYGLYFAGEVYVATHLSAGDPVVRLGDHGGYVADWLVREETCGGFLGYDSLLDIAGEFTSSPIV